MPGDVSRSYNGPTDTAGSIEPAASTMQQRKEIFVAQFKARLKAIVGDRIEDHPYIDWIAKSYWDNEGQRECGPVECAEAEAIEWAQS